MTDVSFLIQEIEVVLKTIKGLYPYAYVPIELISNTLQVLGTEVKIYIAEKLSDAWVEAYPAYASIFQNNEDFLRDVNCVKGKWLEPKEDNGHLCILLSNSGSSEMKYTLSHELRHCYDFIKTWNVWKGKGHTGIPPNSQDYSNWSEFNAVYTDTIFRLSDMGTDNAFEMLSSYLGYKAADCVSGILRNPDDSEYYTSRYLGAHRAVRDFSTIKCPAPVFHLWHMIPQAIDKIDPEAFYKANRYQGVDHFY